jgi:hypothetical protein
MGNKYQALSHDEMAKECRLEAARATSPEIRAEFQRLAIMYERMAEAERKATR